MIRWVEELKCLVPLPEGCSAASEFEAQVRTSDATGSLHQIMRLYEARNKPEQANEWRAKLPRTETTRE